MPLGLFHAHPADKTLGRATKIKSHPFDVRSHQEGFDSHLFGQYGACQILVDDRIHPGEGTAFADHGDTAAPTANDNETHFNQSFDLALLHNGDRPRGGDHPAVPLRSQAYGIRSRRHRRRRQHRTDGFRGRQEGGVFGIHHHIADEADQKLLRLNSQSHQLSVQSRLDHVSDLPLRLGDKNLQRERRHRIAALLLEQEVSHLRTVTVGDDDPVAPGEAGDLADGNPQIFELLLRRAPLVFADQGIAAQGHQQNLRCC